METRRQHEHDGVDVGCRGQLVRLLHVGQPVLVGEGAPRRLVRPRDCGQAGSLDVSLQQVPGVALAVQAEPGETDAQGRGHDVANSATL